MEIKKAIIPIAGLGTRFLPLSKILPKELWPLVDKPVLQYIIEEAKQSGIKSIIFVNSPEKKIIKSYLKKYFSTDKRLKKILLSRKKYELLEEVEKLEKTIEGLKLYYVEQKKPLGDGDALLKAEKKIKDEPFAVLFGDDVVYSQRPCLYQLIQAFNEVKKPVLALYNIPKEKISSYGVVEIKNKLRERLYEIKNIVEKPKPEQAPSDLAIVGKYVLTPNVFFYLKKIKGSIKNEIILANALKNMLTEGIEITGLEFEGKWLECGNKISFIKSNIYLSKRHSLFGKEINDFINTEKNL